MTYEQAIEAIPHASEWVSSFGNPNEGGYCEYHRTDDGGRWLITNGPYDAHPSQFDWQLIEAGTYTTD
jgi:hypothetical protein